MTKNSISISKFNVYIRCRTVQLETCALKAILAPKNLQTLKKLNLAIYPNHPNKLKNTKLGCLMIHIKNPTKHAKKKLST